MCKGWNKEVLGELSVIPRTFTIIKGTVGYLCGDISMSDEKQAPETGTDSAHTETDGTDREKLTEAVHMMARELGISLEEAERAVYARAGTRVSPRSQVVGSIAELLPEMRNVSVRTRVISVHRAERGEGKGVYFYGLMGDSGNDIQFSSWIDFPFGPGDALLVQNASVREWNGRLQLVIGDRSSISVLTDTDDLLPSAEDSMPVPISDIKEGMRGVDLQGRVTEVRQLTVSVKGADRAVVNGLLVDRTGRLPFTCWGPMDLEDGGCYRIIGGSIRSFQGSIKLNFDPGAIVKRLPDGTLPPASELLRPVPYRVHLIEDGLIPGPVILRGILVDIRPGSGLVRKCSECGRRLSKGQCTVHGRSEGEDDLKLRGVFDDGTGTIMAKGGRTIVESLLGRSMEEIMVEARKNMSSDFIVDELRERLSGKTFTIQGDPSVDEYGPSIHISEMRPGLDQDLLMEEIIQMAEVMG
jgi:replication factor A1